MNNVIYLDMDGVLADFDKKCYELIGRTLYDFPDSESGWKAIAPYKDDIYLNLDPMPDAETLVEGVNRLAIEFDYDVGILTGIPKYGRVTKAKLHKIQWLAQRFPEYLGNFNIGPWSEDKYKHCTHGDILIDDSPRNVSQWTNAGGHGILHDDAQNTLARLLAYLRQGREYI